MKFRYYVRLLAIALLLVSVNGYTQVKEQNGVASPHNETAVLKASTQLVVVDVVVQDGNGNPVHGLTANDFHIRENKDQQSIRQFEEHSSAQTSAQPQGKLDLPPGTFTDYTPVKKDAPLNIILLDTVNTPTINYTFLRSQLRDYITHSDPNTRTAIIAMVADKLIMLQTFTADPRILKFVIDNKLDLRGSPFFNDTSLQDQREATEAALEQAGVDVSQGVDPGMAHGHSTVADALQQLQALAETQSLQTTLRMKETIQTMDQLARYLASLPGRKNLIWFSGSFPMSIMPDLTIPNPYAVVSDIDAEYRQMTNLFARAQIAVYPIDARGLMGSDNVDVSHVDKSSGSSRALSLSQSRFFAEQTDGHATMEKIADDTGGRAAYNINSLAVAAKKAVDDGANYYTLAYSPTNHNWDSRFRAIHVDTTGSIAGRHLKLSYRRGYFADDPSAQPNKNTAAIAQTSTPSANSFSYTRAALSFGAPAPTDIVFKVKVLPSTASAEDTIAVNNHPGLNTKGPYRRYSVDYAAITRTLTWKPSPDGQMECNAELGALVYDREGKLLNSVSQPLHFKVSAADFKTLLQQGMQLHLDVSAPAKGDSYLRLAIHDFADDKFGVVEVPTSVVAKLPPAL